MTYVCTFKTSPVCKFNTFVFLLIIDRFSFSGTGFIITENGLSKINKTKFKALAFSFSFHCQLTN